ncbi:MAG: AI-2E family transporter [Bdellovibrionales bacterium]
MGLLNNESFKRQVMLITYAVFLVCFVALLYFARTVVLTCLIGVGIGVLISPILRLLRVRYNIPRALSAFFLFILFTLFLVGLGYGIYLVAADQAIALAEQAPEIGKRLSELATRALRRFPWLGSQIEEIQLGAIVQTTLSQISVGLYSGIGAVSGALFAIFIGLYTAVGAKSYYASMVEVFPIRHRHKAQKFFEESASVLRIWFRAQLIDMVIVGSITALGLWAVGAPYWVLFGILTAIFGIIPYIGVLVMVVVAVLIMLASDPSRIPWVVGVFFLTQQIEGNLVLPLVMRGQADLPEVPLLIFMLIFGSWMGLLGIFIAPPIFAVMRVAYHQFYYTYINQPQSDV